MRIKWIDATKGLAILCVILGHMGGINIAGISPHFVYAFHLPAFFILSGYTLKRKELDIDYINRKFDRLMNPYFLTCFAIMIMDIFNSLFIYDKRTIMDITGIVSKNIVRSFWESGAITEFAGIETGSRIGAIWFLPAIFFAQIIVQWILNQSNSARMHWGMTGCIALVGYISSQFIWLPFSMQSAMTASLFIMAGYYSKKYDVIHKLKWKYYILAILVFIIGIKKQYAVGVVANSYPDLIFTPILAVAGSILLIRLGMFFENNKMLCWSGKNSLLILCAHLFALETLGVYFNKLFHLIKIENIYWWILFFIHVLFSVFLVICISFYQRVISNKIHCKIQVGRPSENPV